MDWWDQDNLHSVFEECVLLKSGYHWGVFSKKIIYLNFLGKCV